MHFMKKYEIQRYKCYIDDCEKPLKYIIEWYGLNQLGENPEIVDECNTCDDFEHLVKASYHNEYGGTPDGIVDYKTGEENPSLLEKVISSMDS